MVLAAGYLLYMYGRVVFGEVSDFLVGLGDHLTDMTPIEILTLVPLATLIVVFGLQPGLLLDLVQGTVTDTLAAAEAGAAIAGRAGCRAHRGSPSSSWRRRPHRLALRPAGRAAPGARIRARATEAGAAQ